jgi:hypothetical protein
MTAMNRSRAARLAGPVVALSVAALLGACTALPGARPIPQPRCGGIDIALQGALSCERIVSIAMETLRRTAPEQMTRGISAIHVQLGTCPRGEMPPMIDCTGEDHAQMVSVHFVGGHPKLDSLTVAIGPVSGKVLGISNPLIR